MTQAVSLLSVGALVTNLFACGDEAEGSLQKCTSTSDCPVGEACVVDEDAETEEGTDVVNGQCVLVACSADDDPCATTLNNGYECVIEEGEDAGVCGQKEGYCDELVVCLNAWQECTDNVCTNRENYCDETTPCETWELCGDDKLCANREDYCDETTLCEDWEVCVEHLCGPVDCAASGADDCNDNGIAMYCDPDTSSCMRPASDCQAATDSGAVWEAGAPIIWNAELFDAVGTSYDPDTLDVTCAGRHAFYVNYYDATGSFPTSNSGLYTALSLTNHDGNTTVTAFAVADSDATEGTFVFFTCVQADTQNETWALFYDDGTVTSNPVCFTVNPT